MEDFAQHYGEMADEEIMELYVDRGGLEPVAQSAVIAEFRSRGLNEDDAIALKRSLIQEHAEIERKQRFVSRFFFGWLGWIQRW
jgi:hypothetical protein